MMIHRSRFEEGQGLVEYALILVLVAVVVIAILTLFGNDLAAYYQDFIDRFSAL
jgi:pilus assembly protein Flp/PilA